MSLLQQIAENLGATGATGASWMHTIAIQEGATGPVGGSWIQAWADAVGVTGPIGGSWIQALADHYGVTGAEGDWLIGIETNTATPPPPPFDPDAQAYLDAVEAAGGTINETIIDATGALFTDMKAAGVYAKIDAFWPVVGGVAGSHAINANLDSTYDLTYNGTWTHNTAGQTPNAANGWADTGWTFPVSSFDNSFGIYVSYKANQGDIYSSDMGCTNNSSYFWLSIWFSAENASRYWNQNKSYFGSVADGGLMINTRTSDSNWRTYLNGVIENTDTSTASGNSAVPNVILGGINYPSSQDFKSGRRQIFAFVGQGLTDAEALDFSIAVNTFQTALERNTY